jgi:L-lactate utilization protein LutB
MSDKGKELLDELKRNIDKTKEKGTLENKFLAFWKIAITFKNQGYGSKHRFGISIEEAVDRYKEQTISMRNDFIENVDSYVEKCIESMKRNNVNVYYAKTNAEAQEIFMKELGDHKVIYKSKSNEAKDTGIIDILKKNNITIKETDLGDVLVQLFDYKLPTYQLGPGIHFGDKEIAAKIKEVYNVEVEPSPQAIVAFFRKTYRNEILNDVKVSLTSANAISADDGSIVLLENEGNISLLTRATEKHIVVVGINKIVPNAFDALLVTKLQGIINNLYTAYTSFISGPSNTSDVRGSSVLGMYGAKEVVVILVDDWRNKAIKENLFYKDLIKCISCKSCNFVCPASLSFGNIFASKYGLGAPMIIRDYIHNGAEAAVTDGLFLCTSCENCKNWCPVDINLGEMMKEIKKIATAEGLCPPPLDQYRKKIIKEKNPFK